MGTPTHFRVQTRGAGKAPLDVRFVGTGPGPAVADFEVIDNHDYSYTVKYTPLQQVRAGATLTHGNAPRSTPTQGSMQGGIPNAWNGLPSPWGAQQGLPH